MDATTISALALAAASALAAADLEQRDHSGLTPEQRERLASLEPEVALTTPPQWPALAVAVEPPAAGALASPPTRS